MLPTKEIIKNINILPLAKLAKVCKDLQEKNLRVVFTNGCFDLLHPGHISLLNEAKSFGDILVVAINSDKAVQKLKGSSRPILKQDERAEVLSSLRMVDYVTIFDELDPLNIIIALRPNILVKGGDWNLDNIIGRKEVESWGGEVRSLSFINGISTTEVISRILQLEKL